MARLRSVRTRREDGVVSAEYAVAAVAACGFGGVLIKVLESPSVMNMIVKVITKAFSFGS